LGIIDCYWGAFLHINILDRYPQKNQKDYRCGNQGRFSAGKGDIRGPAPYSSDRRCKEIESYREEYELEWVGPRLLGGDKAADGDKNRKKRTVVKQDR
jgi:hypothetical protein